MATRKCTPKEFSVGCVEKYGGLSILKSHGALCVRGFDKNGKHVNTCRPTAALARKVAVKAQRVGLQDRYGQLDGPKKAKRTRIPALERSGSWIVTSPSGTVREIYERRNVEKAAKAGWRIETAGQYLGRINREIKDGKHQI